MTTSTVPTASTRGVIGRGALTSRSVVPDGRASVQPVRVLMLSWEYPPLVVGGLGRHVEALAQELVAQGHDVRVVTRGNAVDGRREVRAGVRIVRAAVDPLAIDFTTETLLAWSQA